MARAVLVLLYGVAAALGALYFFAWRPYASRMREAAASYERPAVTKLLDAEILRKVGSFLNDKQSAFTRFPEEKPKGTTRVCTFGDSHTYGQETGVDQDFPSFLQRQFDKSGRAPVEVLNFGSPWHGFHQAFMLWEHFASRFGCDQVLLGPGSFYPLRDTTFNHTDMRAPGYLHARYVLEGDSARLVPVIGDWEGDERLDGFLRFFPHWQYLRYDRNPPPVIRSAMGPGRTIANPFYYRSDSIEFEALALDRILLREMTRRGAKVLLVHDDPRIVDLAKQVLDLNLVAVRDAGSLDFPYLAPEGHRSAWGNEVVARQFHALLTRAQGAEIVLLRTSDLPPVDLAVTTNEPLPLFEYANVKVMLGDHPVGSFSAVEPSRTRGAMEKNHLRQNRVSSLLGLQAGTSLADACYLPVDAALRVGTPLRLVVGPGIEGREIARSSIHSIGGTAEVSAVRLDGLRCRCSAAFVCDAKGLAQEAIPPGTELSVVAGDKKLMRGRVTPSGAIELEPLSGPLYAIRASEGSYEDVDSLDSSGTFDLAFEDSEGRSRRTPLVTWRKEARPIGLRR